jgi:hypothetical protein
MTTTPKGTASAHSKKQQEFFLTNINQVHLTAQNTSAQTGNTMEAVDDYKKKLDSVICDLDSVIEQIIKKQQDSFISAYSHYLQDVKVQLRTLQEDYSVEVYRTKNDEKIAALHKSLDWFKDES